MKLKERIKAKSLSLERSFFCSSRASMTHQGKPDPFLYVVDLCHHCHFPDVRTPASEFLGRGCWCHFAVYRVYSGPCLQCIRQSLPNVKNALSHIFFEFILSVTIFSWHWIQNNLCFCYSVIKWVWCVHILWKATTKLGLSISIWYWLFYVPVATLSWIYIHPSFVCVDDDGWIISILSKNRYHLRWVINIKLSDVIITFCELENIGGKMVQTYRKVLSRLSPRRAEENY